MVSVAVDIGHRQVSSSGRVGSAGPAPSSTTVLAWPRYSVHPHPRPRNRIRLPGIAWLLASAFALPGAPPALAQAPLAAIEAAVEEERRLQAARKLELEIRRIDAHAEWQIEHLNCRADDACERRASKRYEERRREIANAETKAHAAHEKRIAELRAGSRSPSHGRTGAVSSSASPAAIEPALRGEEQRHRARLLELEQRMIDAHAQWQIDHRNCRANDACDKRASQKYDDQRLEIARQRVKERAAHEKKLAELRAGTLSSPRDAVGDVFSSTAGDDRGTAGDPGGVQRGVPPGEGARDGAPQDAGAGDESSPTQRVLPQLGRLPSSRPDARQYAIAGPYPSGRVTLKVTWDEKITEHGQQIHRVGWCSFDVEYLPTGVAKVYEFGYSNADTTWPFQGQKQVEVTDIRPTFPPEGTEFGVPGQSLRIRQGRGGDGRPRFTIDFVNPIYSGFTTIYRYTSWDGRVIAQDPVQGRTYRNAFCLQQITDVPALVGRFPPNSGSPRVRMPDVGLFKQVPYANLDVSWSFVPAGRREGAR